MSYIIITFPLGRSRNQLNSEYPNEFIEIFILTKCTLKGNNSGENIHSR